jgi:hypothetical protein
MGAGLMPTYNEELLFLEKKQLHEAQKAGKKGGMTVPKQVFALEKLLILGGVSIGKD